MDVEVRFLSRAPLGTSLTRHVMSFLWAPSYLVPANISAVLTGRWVFSGFLTGSVLCTCCRTTDPRRLSSVSTFPAKDRGLVALDHGTVDGN